MNKTLNEIALEEALSQALTMLTTALTLIAMNRGAVLKAATSPLTYKYEFITLLEGNIERTTIQTFSLDAKGYLQLVDTDVVDKPAA